MPSTPEPQSAPQMSVVHMGLLPALRAMKRDFLSFQKGLFYRHGDAIRLKLKLVDLLFLNTPEMAHHVLVRNAKNYGKNTRGYDNLRQVLGNGLVTSQGDFWMRQRRIALPAFHHKRLAIMADKMVVAANDFAQRWSTQVGDEGMRLEMDEELARLTLRIICETMLSVDSEDGSMETVGHSVEVLLDQVLAETVGLALPRFIATPGRKRFKQALGELDDIVLGIIEERRKDGEQDHGDLLSMFMAVQDEETGERMNDVQLRDEIMTMFLAGHETTATALTWTLYLLARHPAERRLLIKELEETLNGEPVTFADLKRLPRLERVLKESMRLFPPVPNIARMAEDDDTIDGLSIKKGDYVIVSPNVLHRHPRYWDNPESFDSDRFLPERIKQVPRLAYIPFSAGQRMCIGNRFAMMEASLILATILPRLTFDLVPGHPIAADGKVTLRPRFGMPMRVRNRR